VVKSSNSEHFSISLISNKADKIKNISSLIQKGKKTTSKIKRGNRKHHPIHLHLAPSKT